jgi:hypothetical protein
MSKIIILAGIVFMALTGLATLGAVATGTAQWVGLAAPHPMFPPQSLVVGGLFLGIPLVAAGWGLIWLGGWLRNHGAR